jgi:hypothetical protein
MKVSIEAGGRKVELECPDQNVTYDQVADKVLETWKATDGAATGTAGPAFGLASAERAPGVWKR